MPVAKSYEKMTIVGEPYEVDKKMYVRVIGPCKRCGGSGHYSMNAQGDTTCYRCNGHGKENMEVRWYTESQRAALDRAAKKRAEKKKIEAEERAIKFKARNAFGFGEAGYITLVIGEYDTIQAWRETLPEHTVWYNEIFGWFISSANTPDSFPADIKTIRLDWDAVKINDLEMKPNEEVHKYVESLTHEPCKSEYQGTPGEWLIKEVTIKQALNFDGMFGANTMHIMEDADENIYVWSTASKHLEVGSTIKMKMKVKEHKEYKGIKQTVVYYCKESK